MCFELEILECVFSLDFEQFHLKYLYKTEICSNSPFPAIKRCVRTFERYFLETNRTFKMKILV